MKRALTFMLVALFAAGSLFAQQTTPPAPAAPREAKLPEAAEKTLANGLRVVVVPRAGVPLVAARVMIRTGAAADPAGRDGLAQLTSSVLTKGTKTRSAQEIARGVEALGATIETDAGWDSTSVDLSVMSPNLDKALEVVADVVRNATFAGKELELERAQAIDSMQVTLGQPGSVASLVATRLLFGDSPYGHSANGTPKSLARIRRDDLVAFHRNFYRPDNAALVLAGDVTPDAAFALAERLFGSWKKGAPVSAPAAPAQIEARRRVVVIDMPEAGQAAVVVARPGIRRTDPAYYRALVANSVLGGGYSARLNQEIRIKRGLSYGAGSSFQPRLYVGPFAARTETKNESAPEVADVIVAQMTGLASADVPETELTPRKAVLIGDFGQSLESAAGIVDRVSALALYGLPLREINGYVGNVQAVTAEQVRRFAASNLRGEDATIVIAGDAKKFEEQLRKQFESVEVIPIADLDLNSPTLRMRKAKG